MNKGSHIVLAQFLMNDISLSELQRYKKAFLIGNILPDCLPSFLTTRHTITETLDLLQGEIRMIFENYHAEKGITPYFCRHLGIICHYIADYFTFPHNQGFYGSVKDHIIYEKELFVKFQQYVSKQNEDMVFKTELYFYTAQDICKHIMDKHMEYLRVSHDVQVDCQFILETSYTAVKVIMDKLLDAILFIKERQTQAA